MKVKKDEGFKVQDKITVMSMSEFKAWLEGFSECFNTGAPNKSQWKRIEERLNSVSVQQEIVYRDRPYWWPNWYNNSWWTYTTPIYGGVGSTGGINNTSNGVANIMCSNNADMIYTIATEIGKQEAQEFIV